MTDLPSHTNPGEAAAPQSDPLARLYHMSTTAGVGAQEYVAINPVAIAAVILGLFSVLVILSSIFLVVPLAGIVCGILAIVQVRRSNQTQTGVGLALMGLLLSFAFGGGRLGVDLVRRFHVSADERQIAQLMNQLGKYIDTEQYQQAYQLFDDRFRNRVDLAAFQAEFQRINDFPSSGHINLIEWNKQPMQFESNSDTGVVEVEAMALISFKNRHEPSRMIINFQKSDGPWRVDNIPDLFPIKKKTSP